MELLRHNRRLKLSGLRLARRDCLGLITTAALTFGCHSEASLREPPRRFRVSGPSMAPTFRGDRRVTACTRCKIEIAVPTEFLRDNLLGGSFVCWHCGSDVASDSGIVVPGEIVELSTSGAERLNVGDLVAVDHDGAYRIKRVFAAGGSIVSLRGNQLLVDGLSLNEAAAQPLPTVPVDLDRLRADSRWKPQSETSGWQRTQRVWHQQGPGDGSYLVYHHLSVYDHDRPAPVRDDYPGNVSLRRQLFPVCGLGISGKISCRGGGRLELVFWNGIATVTRDMAVSSDRDFEWQVPLVSPQQNGNAFPNTVSAETPQATAAGVVGPTRPFALRVLKGSDWRVSDLRVDRQLTYRLGPRHPRQPYPLKLKSSEYFLVGDNVPVSVDSRTWGPIKKNQIAGRIRSSAEE